MVLDKTIIAPERLIKMPIIVENGDIIQKEGIVRNELPSRLNVEIPNLSVKKKKKKKHIIFDHIIPIGGDLNTSLMIEEAGICGKEPYLFDMISNLDLNKVVAMIHKNLNSCFLFNGYNIETEKTRIHQLKIPHMSDPTLNKKLIINNLTKYYDIKLKEMCSIMESNKKILFVYNHVKGSIYTFYVYQFINKLTSRFPGSKIYLLTCGYSKTTNTKHINFKTKKKCIEYLQKVKLTS